MTFCKNADRPLAMAELPCTLDYNQPDPIASMNIRLSLKDCTRKPEGTSVYVETTAAPPETTTESGTARSVPSMPAFMVPVLALFTTKWGL